MKRGMKMNGIRVLERPAVSGGMLTASGSHFRIGNETWCVAECACGGAIAVHPFDIKRSHVVCCGCRHPMETHGHSHGKKGTEYASWISMRLRCRDPKAKEFENYGAIGITICDRWCESFEAFLADMGPKPTPAHTIDRFPNQSGNYEPGNCRWATPTEQANNRKSNVRLTIYGKTLTVAEWSRISQVKQMTIGARLRNGVPAKTAVFTPPLSPRGSRTPRLARAM